MEEKYLFIEVHGNVVICNSIYSNLEIAKETLHSAFNYFINDSHKLEYGKDCWEADDRMSAWAIFNGTDSVWTIIKTLR